MIEEGGGEERGGGGTYIMIDRGEELRREEMVPDPKWV